VKLLRIWLAGTAVALVAMAAWTLAPVLVFMAVLVVVLGLAAAGMVALARVLRRWRERGLG
jgi:hypothetical protein